MCTHFLDAHRQWIGHSQCVRRLTGVDRRTFASLSKEYKSTLVSPLLFSASKVLKDYVLLVKLMFPDEIEPNYASKVLKDDVLLAKLMFPDEIDQMSGRTFNLDMSGWKFLWKKVVILVPLWNSFPTQVFLLLIETILKRPCNRRNGLITLTCSWSTTVSQLADTKRRRLTTFSEGYEDQESQYILFRERQRESLVCLFNGCLSNVNLSTSSHGTVRVWMRQHYARYVISPAQSDHCDTCSEYKWQINGARKGIAHKASSGNYRVGDIENKKLILDSYLSTASPPSHPITRTAGIQERNPGLCLFFPEVRTGSKCCAILCRSVSFNQ